MIPAKFEQNNQNSSGIKKKSTASRYYTPLQGGALRAGVPCSLDPRFLRLLALSCSSVLVYSASTGFVLNASAHSQRNADQST